MSQHWYGCLEGVAIKSNGISWDQSNVHIAIKLENNVGGRLARCWSKSRWLRCVVEQPGIRPYTDMPSKPNRQVGLGDIGSHQACDSSAPLSEVLKTGKPKAEAAAEKSEDNFVEIEMDSVNQSTTQRLRCNEKRVLCVVV